MFFDVNVGFNGVHLVLEIMLNLSVKLVPLNDCINKLSIIQLYSTTHEDDIIATGSNINTLGIKKL